MPLSFWAPQNQHSLRNLGPLALIAPLLERLSIATIIDRHLPPGPQLEFSHGRVLSLLMAARLCEPNALVNIPQWAHEHAADILWNIPADKLNDDRLGRALDAFFEQRHSIMANVTARALELAELSLTRLHFDTTDVTFCGTYDSARERLQDFRDSLNACPSDSQRPPARITKGYLSDRRMLQVGVTSVVDERGAVPIFCCPVDGNHNGHTAIHQQFELLRKHLPLPQGMQMVSDRGTFSAAHVARLHRHGYTFLGAVPWGDYQALYDRHSSQLDWQRATYLSQEQQRRRAVGSSLPQEHYEIATVEHQLVDPRNAAVIPCRVLFCHSSAAEKEEAQRRLDNIAVIRSGLDDIARKLQRGHPKTTYESALRQIGKLFGKKDAARYFSYELRPLTPTELAALPDPRKGFTRPTHRLVYRFDAAAAQRAAAYDGLSALLSTAAPSQSADTLFSQYKQQAYVELGHHQFKTPLAVRPVFLKSPQRVEALICLLALALQAYQMLERLYRQNTSASAPKSERLMTAEQMLKAFAVCGIAVQAVPIGQIVQASRLKLGQSQILLRLHFPTPHELLAERLPLAPPESLLSQSAGASQ
jgi:transposase